MGLSKARIIDAAVAQMDEEGVNGLKMRRLSERLGAGVMSLYWHVESKEKLFDLALDAVLEYRGPSPGVEPADWRDEIADILTDWRAGMLRHPWSVSLLPRRALGPNILHRLEHLACVLTRAGVPDANLNVAIWSLWNYVMGATMTRASFSVGNSATSATPPQNAPLADPHPTITRTSLLLDADWDGTFSQGLKILLDGLALSK
jgi:AcrR family transcriptional regulator